MRLATFSTILVSAGAMAAVGSAKPVHHKKVAADDFIKVSGMRLEDSHGAPHYLTGINYWSCMNLAADTGDYDRFITELDQMAAKGINHLRIMAASEGNPEPQPFRMRPALQLAPGKYNEKIFVGLDRCLAEMAKRGMRATMTLNNQWQWSGGFNQYISWAKDNEKIRYPSSWNMTAPPQRPDGKTGWGNYTEGEGSFDDYVAYGNEIYTNQQAEEWYKAHIDKVLNRRNTVNGRLYKDDATVMTWQLANEPQPANSDTKLGPFALEYPPNPQDPLLSWIDRISTYIKERAPKQLVNVGLEGKQGEWYWKEVHRPKNVDYGTTHAWVQNWGIYNMTDPTRASLDVAKQFATDFIANSSRWANEIQKPVFLEEFGMARDNWQNDEAAGEYLYASKATTTHKDEYFTHIIGKAMDSFMSDEGGYVGTCPWAYGSVFRPETQEADKYGMVWAGDPPHEAPGWYDLYDTDKAMDIVRDQQNMIHEFLTAEKENHTK